MKGSVSSTDRGTFSKRISRDVAQLQIGSLVVGSVAPGRFGSFGMIPCFSPMPANWRAMLTLIPFLPIVLQKAVGDC